MVQVDPILVFVFAVLLGAFSVVIQGDFFLKKIKRDFGFGWIIIAIFIAVIPVALIVTRLSTDLFDYQNFINKHGILLLSGAITGSLIVGLYAKFT